MNRAYTIITPNKEEDFDSEWKSCLSQLGSVAMDDLKIFKIVVFIDATDETGFNQTRENLTRDLKIMYGENCPAFTILSEMPEPPYSVVMEVGSVSGNMVQIKYKNESGLFYSVVEDPFHYEVWACGMGAYSSTGSVEQDSLHAFIDMNKVLDAEEMTFDHVIRQWNYVGEILKLHKTVDKELQNYQVFNEVRGRYYSQYRTTKDFPAATGIGVKIPGVTIDFFAEKALDDKVATFPVNNHKQENPYVYGQEVLVGSVPMQKTIKQAPQFERGRLLCTPYDSTLYLSGTASIIGQHTVGINDVEKQTYVTIDHLRELDKSLRRQEHETNSGEEYKYSILRVYVKNERDFPLVRKICVDEFPNVPIIFVQADVCRDNLLVEIEGEVSFRMI